MSRGVTHERGTELVVRAADPTAEILVIDGQFRIARDAGSNAEIRGVSQLYARLLPGLYRVKCKIGGAIYERPVALERGQERVELEIAARNLPFAAAAPVLESRTSHEYHHDAAARLSRTVHTHAGSGSELFLFVRDVERGPDHDVLRGLSLHGADGVALPELSVNAVTSDAEQQGQWAAPWAGITLAVAPGTYRLRLRTDYAGVLEQAIVASPGWQTQVFFLRRRYGVDGALLADLAGQSVTMSRQGIGFQPFSQDIRVAEAARLALASGRGRVARAVMDYMLTTKFENPFLGIYAGHLLLKTAEPNWDLLATVAGNLHGMVGDHPDVAAIGLALEAAGHGVARPVPGGVPPMLRASWDLMVQATATLPDSIPEGSLADFVADRLWGAGPWLLWQLEAARDSSVVEAISTASEEAILTEDEEPRRNVLHLNLEPGVIEDGGLFAGRTEESVGRAPKPKKTGRRAHKPGATAATLDDRGLRELGERAQLDDLEQAIVTRAYLEMATLTGLRGVSFDTVRARVAEVPVGALVRELRLPAHAAQRARERASEKLRSMRRVGRDESAGEVAADAGYGVVPADDTVEGAEWLHEFGARQPVRESMPQRTTEPIVGALHRRTRQMITARVALVIAVLVAIAVFLGPPVAFVFRTGSPRLDPSRIAVLAFEDRSEGHTLQHSAQVVRETLTRELAAVKEVHVVSRDLVSPYPVRGVASMARALKVGTVVAGAAYRLPSGPEVTIEVVDGSSGTHVATWRVDLRDSASVQHDVAAVAADLVRLRLEQAIRRP